MATKKKPILTIHTGYGTQVKVRAIIQKIGLPDMPSAVRVRTLTNHLEWIRVDPIKWWVQRPSIRKSVTYVPPKPASKRFLKEMRKNRG